MGEVLGVSRSRAIENDRHESRETDISVGDVLSDIAKRILWPENTAANLAAISGCSVRQAERYLGGHEWSGDAVAALMAEILRRRGLRNFKVVPKR